MNGNQKVLKSQLDAIGPVLERLRVSIAPEYLGLITATGQPISVISSNRAIDADALAALASSSFAAAKELGQILENQGVSVVLHEGKELNLQIARVTDSTLLVVCFRGFGEIGRVRLVMRRAARVIGGALSQDMTPKKEKL